MLTTKELLFNWAKGEWLVGQDPRPLPPNRCASIEGNYIPETDWRDIDLSELESKEQNRYSQYHHDIVNNFYKKQVWIVKRVMVLEYVEQLGAGKFKGIPKKERREQIAKKLRLSAQTLNLILKDVDARLKTFVEGKV